MESKDKGYEQRGSPSGSPAKTESAGPSRQKLRERLSSIKCGCSLLHVGHTRICRIKMQALQLLGEELGKISPSKHRQLYLSKQQIH